MSEVQKLTIEVVGQKDDLTSFVQLMAFINECRLTGHHGTVKLEVDGDGSASIAVSDQMTGDLIISENQQIMHAIDDKSIWIGE